MEGILGALAGFAGVAMQAKAQADANNLNWANLFETKRVNRKQEQLATSSREDAYGNKIVYIPGVGWKTRTTPTTKAILEGEQTENLANIKEDAPRNRAAAVRRDNRSISADDEFKNAFAKYRYRDKPNEAALIGEETDATLRNRRKGLSEATAAFSKQLLRQGDGASIAGLLKSADDIYAGSLDDAFYTGKQRGRAAYKDALGSDPAQAELSFLSGLADDSGSSAVSGSTYNADLSGRSDSALQQLLATIQANEGRRMDASNTLAASLAQSPDMGPLASALGKIGGGGGGFGRATGGVAATGKAQGGYSDFVFPRPYEEGVLARQRAAANGF